MNKSRAVLWMLAGGYLEYQAYNLIIGLSDASEGVEKMVVILSIILFIIAGAVIFVSGLKRFIAITKEENGESAAEEEAAEEQAAEGAVIEEKNTEEADTEEIKKVEETEDVE